MDEVKKAKELIVDDRNFASKDYTLNPDMLELLNYSRVNDYWSALFRVKNRPDYIYEVTYDERTKTAVIFTWNTTNSSIIHE